MTIILSLIVVGIAVLITVRLRKRLKRDARGAGYGSIMAYLQAPPHSDKEKRDSIDMAVAGLIICLLGLAFPPLLLVGVFPLYYGSRKIAYASLGLGLTDDDQTSN
jgi:hypothetical protein